MARKKSSDGLTPEEWAQLGHDVRSGIGGAIGFMRSKLVPTKQDELNKLQAEVIALENKQNLEAQIKALKEKREALLKAKHEADEEEDIDEEEEANVFA